MENSVSYWQRMLMQEIEEVSYEKSGLENPDKADRDKDKDISPWEKKVGAAIEKNMEEGEDHEVSMANNSLESILKHVMDLKAKLGNEEKDIPAWIQDHITNAANFISQAAENYHEYGDHHDDEEASIDDLDEAKDKDMDYKEYADQILKKFPLPSAAEIAKKVKDEYGEHNFKKFIDYMKSKTKGEKVRQGVKDLASDVETKLKK